MKRVVILSLIAAGCCCLCAAVLSQAADSSSGSSSKSSSSTATQSRQSGASAAASMIGAIGSLVPGLITNVAPLVLLFGLGALMMPALGMSAMGLLRESRRSSNEQVLPNVALPSAFAQYARPLQASPQDIYYFTKRSFPSLMSNINTASLMHGMQEILERVARAIENADKRYN